MKTLILILFLITSIQAQSWFIPIMTDDKDNTVNMSFTGTATGNIIMQGTGVITVIWGDGTSNDYTLTGVDQNVAHTYSSGTYNMQIIGADKITKFYINSNAGTWVIDTKEMVNATYIRLNNITGKFTFDTANHKKLTRLELSTLSGDSGTNIRFNSSNVTSLTNLQLINLNTGTISITFNSANVTSLTNLQLITLNTGTISITFNSANVTSLTVLQLSTLNTGTISITVNTANVASLTNLYLNALNTGTRNITANPADITANITYFRIDAIGAGATIDMSYTTKTWANNQNRVSMIVPSGGLTSTEIDNMLIDLANVTTWTGEKLINLTGAGNASRTAASDAAVTTLVGKGVTVTTNP